MLKRNEERPNNKIWKRVTLTQRVCSKSSVVMEGIPLISRKLCIGFANSAITFSSSDTPSIKHHAIEAVGAAVSSERVSSRHRVDSRLIIRCVRYPITCAWDGTSMQSVIPEWEGADDNIVSNFVIHLIPVLEVYSGTSDVVEHILFDGCRMSAVNDYSPLVTVLDCIVLE